MSEPRESVKGDGEEGLGPLLARALTSQAVAYYEALAERMGLNATDLRSLELLTAETNVTPGRLACAWLREAVLSVRRTLRPSAERRVGGSSSTPGRHGSQ